MAGDALTRARDNGTLVINPIIYAEVSAGFDRIEDLDDAVTADDFEREPLPYQAGFIAGKAFLIYRKRGGRDDPRYPTSISAHTPPYADTGSLPATPPATAPTSPPSN